MAMFFPLFESVTDLKTQADTLRRRSYGVIEIEQEEFKQVRLRPWPKMIALPQVFAGRRFHRTRSGNRCWLYYNQPRSHSNFIALKYVLSTRQCTLETFRLALSVLDEIANIKRADALLCDVQNPMITDRLMKRWGWQSHCNSSWHRNFIKRFYEQHGERVM